VHWAKALLVMPAFLIFLSAGIACSSNKSIAPASTSSSGAVATGPADGNATPSAQATPATTAAAGSDANRGGDLLHLSAAVGRVKPATVQITNQQVQLNQLNQAFTVPAGVGSGFVYDAQGDILTNNHVVEGAQNLLVSLPDGRSFPGQVVGKDPRTDLAVVRVNAANLPVAKLGDSSALQVGDWSVAIGNALNLPGGPTVTVGVISALGRTTQEPGNGNSQQGPFLFDLIQTDASINPGNSGGPLTDLSGQVIGINTLVAGEAEPGVQAQGIGFAISINSAKPIADALIANGSINHSYLGVGYVVINPAIAAQVRTDQKQGALVQMVQPGSPAAKAGINQGDIITQIGGKDVVGESDLAEQLDKHKPGDKVTLTVARNGSTQKMDVTLGAATS